MLDESYKSGLKRIIEGDYKNIRSGIYEIRCLENNSFYIGSTNNFERRFATHKFQLHHKKHSNYKLQIDFCKFGLDKFVFTELSVVSSSYNRNLLYDLEQGFIDRLSPDYNIQKTVEHYTYIKKEIKVKGVRRLKEGITGGDLRGVVKKHKHKKKKQVEVVDYKAAKKKYKSVWKKADKVKKESYLAALNKTNDRVNARRKELGK